MNVELEVNGRLKILPMVCLLSFLQIACTYTPVYDSSGNPQTTAPDASVETVPPKRENSIGNDSQTAATEQPVRVAVVSPDSVKLKPTASNKDIAAARLRTQAADAVAEGQTAKAERLLNRALRISPRSPETYHQLATIRLEQGASGQALQLARKGLSLCDPDSILAEQLQALAIQASAD